MSASITYIEEEVARLTAIEADRYEKGEFGYVFLCAKMHAIQWWADNQYQQARENRARPDRLVSVVRNSRIVDQRQTF